MLGEWIDAGLDGRVHLSVLSHTCAPRGRWRVQRLVQQLPGAAFFRGQPGQRSEQIGRVAEALQQRRVIRAEGEGGGKL